MSQKRDQEEALELKVSTKETLTLCPDNCKISAATTQTCSGSTTSDAKPESTWIDSAHQPTGKPKNGSERRDSASTPEVVAGKGHENGGEDYAALASLKKAVNRCSGCGKRVGLTGFRCRCGELFCSVHRYSDRHDCSFDYKAAGREAIARENPVIRAAKISRI